MTEQATSGSNDAQIDLSIIIPFFNDEELVSPLARRLKEVFRDDDRYEFILIDDGSSDQTFERLSAICKEDRRFRAIRLGRNCGQRSAITAGMKRMEGKMAATMDPDLQNDPADILKLALLLDGDVKLANGFREKRFESLWNRRIPSYITNWILSIVSGIKMKDFGCPIAVFQAELVRETMRLSPNGLFSKTLASMIAKDISEIPVSHGCRSAGESSYNLYRLLKMFHFLVFTALELRLLMAGMSPGAIKAGLFIVWAINVVVIVFPLVNISPISFLLFTLLSLPLFFLSSFAISLKNNKSRREEVDAVVETIP